ncbi:MAG TPA: hypothetical protein VJN43_19340 [Bryobacteraceae bacterium]|nr:hypothetical protein [Bryobacteraceae bacterium]
MNLAKAKAAVKYFALYAGLMVIGVVSALLVNKYLIPKVRAELNPLKSYQVWYRIDNSNGTGVQAMTARRSNGDSVTVILNDTNPLMNNYTVLELPSQGLVVALAGNNSNMMTYGKGIPYEEKDLLPDCSSAGTLVPGDVKQIAGVTAVHLAPTEENPAGVWVVPALNCLTVEGTAVGGTLKQVRTTMQVILGEPPGSLFAIPPGRTEVKPSIFYPSTGRGTAGAEHYFAHQDAKYQSDMAARIGAQ